MNVIFRNPDDINTLKDCILIDIAQHCAQGSTIERIKINCRRCWMAVQIFYKHHEKTWYNDNNFYRLIYEGEYFFSCGLQYNKNKFIEVANQIVHFLNDYIIPNEQLIGRSPVRICVRCGCLYLNYEECECVTQERERDENEKELRYGLVYFIQADSKVKIGYVKDEKYSAIENRLKTLQTGIPCPPDLIKILHFELGGRKKESELHVKFKEWRIDPRREWFVLSDEIKEYIKKRKGAA